MFNLIKLGLYFSLINGQRLDPMVFELINRERRLRDRSEADRNTREAMDEDIRKAA